MQAALKSLLRNIPNTISAARLVATPFLLVDVISGDRFGFTWLLLVCMVSDIVDGCIARTFQLQSRLGATLDSIADLMVTLMAFVGVAAFEAEFVTRHYLPLLVLAFLYVFSVVAGLWRFGRLASLHTFGARIAAYAQGTFVMSLFLWGFQPAIFWIAIAVSIVAYLEELAIVWVLREWRTDVRGLYWVLAQQR